MSKALVAMFVLFFTIASCIVVIKPAFSSVDVVEDSWVSKGSMQQARGGLGVVAINGKIYAIGGSTVKGSGGDFVGTNEVYDPETDTWTTKSSMPTPRTYFAIAAYQNKIYCIGGVVGFAVDDEHGVFYHEVMSGVNEVYDTVTDTWETKSSLPDDGMIMQAHVVNGKIYVVDRGWVYAYDPNEDSWVTKTGMPKPYPEWDSWPMSAAVDNKIVFTFAYSTFNFSTGETWEQKVMVYDVETDSWSGGTSGQTTVAVGAAAATTGVKAPRKVYVFGVWNGQPKNQVYDVEADVWENATAMSKYRTDFGVAVDDDVLYVIGGYISGSSGLTAATVNEQYIPIGYGVPPEVEVVSPVNQTYVVSNVSLAFTVNKTVSWVGYSVDGQDNVSISGNTTISGLTNGVHNVTVYAEDSFGNVGASVTVSFTVEVPEPFPIAFVAAVSAAFVVIAGAGLLVYLKKRKR